MGRKTELIIERTYADPDDEDAQARVVEVLIRMVKADIRREMKREQAAKNISPE